MKEVIKNLKTMQLSSLYNIGMSSLTEPKASKVKISNIVTLITCGVALLYALFFFIALEQPMLGLMNFGFVVAYALTLMITYAKKYTFAKLSFFIVLMIHVLVLSIYIFTPSSSFYFYYLLFPCGIFLLFDDEDIIEKLFVVIAGSLLFFFCHTYENPTPLVELSKQTEQSIFISAIVVIILEIYFIMALFSNAISRHEHELTILATLDPLTGVNNRRTMITLGEEFFEHAKRYQKSMSVIMLDIDHFKQVNDNHGHATGDKILQLVSKVLNDNTRSCDIVARYGGEEFVILLPETDIDAAHQLADDLRVLISNESAITEVYQAINCTASFGISEYNEHSLNFAELLNQADIALYQSKNSGRNKVTKFKLNPN